MEKELQVSRNTGAGGNSGIYFSDGAQGGPPAYNSLTESAQSGSSPEGSLFVESSPDNRFNNLSGNHVGQFGSSIFFGCNSPSKGVGLPEQKTSASIKASTALPLPSLPKDIVRPNQEVDIRFLSEVNQLPSTDFPREGEAKGRKTQVFANIDEALKSLVKSETQAIAFGERHCRGGDYCTSPIFMDQFLSSLKKLWSQETVYFLNEFFSPGEFEKELEFFFQTGIISERYTPVFF